MTSLSSGDGNTGRKRLWEVLYAFPGKDAKRFVCEPLYIAKEEVEGFEKPILVEYVKCNGQKVRLIFEYIKETKPIGG